MLETFLAGFLGVVVGAAFVSFAFFRAYVAERAIASEVATNMLKIMQGEAKVTKNGSVLSLFKDDDKNKPVN